MGVHKRLTYQSGCRLPFESPKCGDGYAMSGPCKTRQMTPEEKEKYGSPELKTREGYISVGMLKNVIERADSAVEAAGILRINSYHLRYLLKHNCIKVPKNWKEEDKLGSEDKPKTRMEIARETLNREQYQELKNNGHSDSQICKDNKIAPDIMVNLKKEWGLEIGQPVCKRTVEKESPDIAPQAVKTKAGEYSVSQLIKLKEELETVICTINKALDNTKVVIKIEL